MIQVYLIKRMRKKRKRNGQRETCWALRWQDARGWRCESTGTADRTQAEAMLVTKRKTLNDPQAALRPAVQVAELASWQDARAALDRAMRADNLRPRSVEDAVETFDGFRAMFPGINRPADVTPEHANEYKRLRAEKGISPWTIRSDLATLKASFGKWLGRECGLLDPEKNPFKGIRPPKCDDPEVRIVSAAESEALFDWLAQRWNCWRLPAVYLQVAALLGWRATEIASIREADMLADGFVRVTSLNCKTRRVKYGWLPEELYQELQTCSADGWAFGRFSDELRRLLMLWKRQPNHAAMVKVYTPKRLVGWLQDELKRFNAERAAAVAEARDAGQNVADWQPFTLHDFRRTAITGLQMAGVSEKDCSLMVGATPEVIRKHYEQMDRMTVAKRSVEKRLATAPANPDARLLRAFLRAGPSNGLDETPIVTQTA